VLTRKTLELMRTPRMKERRRRAGLGWHLRRVGGVMTAAHGGTPGHCLLIELVPERNFAMAILTNHTEGWRLIQDVERAALNTLEGMSLDPAQPIGHRGVNETMPNAPIMKPQPDSGPYVGTYRKPPWHRSRAGRPVMVDNSAIAFYRTDLAVVTSGNQRGNPIESSGQGRHPPDPRRRPDRQKD
jgi:hypothetical protein